MSRSSTASLPPLPHPVGPYGSVAGTQPLVPFGHGVLLSRAPPGTPDAACRRSYPHQCGSCGGSGDDIELDSGVKG